MKVEFFALEGSCMLGAMNNCRKLSAQAMLYYSIFKCALFEASQYPITIRNIEQVVTRKKQKSGINGDLNTIDNRQSTYLFLKLSQRLILFFRNANKIKLNTI